MSKKREEGRGGWVCPKNDGEKALRPSKRLAASRNRQAGVCGNAAVGTSIVLETVSSLVASRGRRGRRLEKSGPRRLSANRAGDTAAAAGGGTG